MTCHIHQARAAVNCPSGPRPSYTTTMSCGEIPSASAAAPKAAGEGSISGRLAVVSEMAARSQKRAPGMRPAWKSAAPAPARAQGQKWIHAGVGMAWSRQACPAWGSKRHRCMATVWMLTKQKLAWGACVYSHLVLRGAKKHPAA